MTEVAEAPAGPEQVAVGAPTTEEEARQLATQWANDQAARLTERVQQFLASKNGHGNGNLAPRIGAPTTYEPSGKPYVPFDVLATSPIQFTGPPPYLPSKIIAVGNFAYLIAYIFTNPSVDIPAGWAVPASVQLGGRPWRATLDQTNLTTGTTSTQARNGVFGSPAAVYTAVPFYLPTTGPTLGGDPWLIEANVTVYVDAPAQPFAAFATKFYDWDNDPGYPFFPPETAGYRYDLPNRYLIFS
jgi:hypothetical protein